MFCDMLLKGAVNIVEVVAYVDSTERDLVSDRLPAGLYVLLSVDGVCSGAVVLL